MAKHEHTIYFAVDTDMTEDENLANAIPYFKGVASVMNHYKIGVYGPRNTCLMVSDAVSAVKYSYVSNMSTGFSGNLGFSQPLNWAFDQFDEVGSEGNLPARDKVGVSYEDEGVTELVASRQPTNWIEDSNWKVMKQLIGTHELELNGKPYVLINDAMMKVSACYKNVTSVNTDNDITFSYPIKNGKIDSSISLDFAKGGVNVSSELNQLLNKFTAGLESGYVTINAEMEKNSHYLNKVSIEISDEKFRSQGDDFSNHDVVVIDVEFNWSKIKNEVLEEAVKPTTGALQKSSKSIISLIEGGLNLIGQALFGLMSAISSILQSVGQIPASFQASINAGVAFVITLIFFFFVTTI
ncbi:DUF1906 domain-containing protein [Fructobacillus sp. M158]|uniref:glycoside hydrolase domain-containing protein n=1 Tax=Fructobacillus parabroussonetiae TaxID=2713174 RepID=UPI0024A7015C|nr:glycoside hydrolase domain-containing protein [Fructobacillus parabroussonetiae]MCK8617843.1 DUF1906 domain-containing protein [Fructobacillus parabroussonetiae]